jgi:hypothetical protein
MCRMTITGLLSSGLSMTLTLRTKTPVVMRLEEL